MLHEHKPKIKKQTTKQLRFKRVKKLAQELLSIAWTNDNVVIKSYLASNPPQSAEDERSKKALLYGAICDNCLLMAEAFESSVKKIRGKYFAD